MGKKYTGCLFDLIIQPNNQICLECVDSSVIYFSNPSKIYYNSDVLIIQGLPDEPVHKFINMCEQWAYVGPMENNL